MKTKMMRPKPLESDAPVGLRIGPNDKVEWMTKAETEAVVNRAIREAMAAAGRRLKRTLH